MSDRHMTDADAMSIVYGLSPVADLFEAARVVDYLDERPWLLTSGEACRGLEQLRELAYPSWVD